MVSENVELAQVREYWNKNICEIQEHLLKSPRKFKTVSSSPLYSREYFEDIERHRYTINPEIFAFAQFTRYRDKKVLEVGVGSGVDFIQWCRAGAEAYGIDLTPNGIEHAKRWLREYSLNGNLAVGDAEHLLFADDTFDLVYSWGVLHHTPNTHKAIQECIRVCKPNGEVKLMLYNRRSLAVFGVWLHVLVRCRKFATLSEALANGIESVGTKAFTKAEVREICKPLSVRVVEIKAKTNKYDFLFRYPLPIRVIAYMFNWLSLFNDGFFMTVWLRKE